MLNRVDTSFNLSKRFNYSTDEKVIETWIDGKPIYRKVFDITTPSEKGQFDIDGASNIETVIMIDGFMNPSNGWNARVNTWQDSSAYTFFNFNTSTKKFYFSTGENSFKSCNCKLILQYTKTTD